ncbi:MAG TPA: hypothetical protein DIT97_05185, partial [Gimesia maris]|nr:hypothetical protein [Gimesia maris]
MQHIQSNSDPSLHVSVALQEGKREQIQQSRCIFLIALFLLACLMPGCGKGPIQETVKRQPAEAKPIVEAEKTTSPETKPVAEAKEVATSKVPNRMMKAREKMNSILLGLINYYDNHNMFCPDTSIPENYAPSGRPHLSWRVHILPFMGEEDLFQQFKLNEPWDSPH